MRQEKWSEAEATAMNISSLDELECKFRYKKFRSQIFLYKQKIAYI